MNPRPITGDNDDDEKEEERKRKKKKEKERKKEKEGERTGFDDVWEWIGVYGEYGHDDHPANDFMDCIVFYKVCLLCFV